MSLEVIPDELVARIFQNLLDDPESFSNLLATCKRFCSIGNNFLVITPKWRESRLFAFNLELALEQYLPKLCQQHGHCIEQESRTMTRCEVQHNQLSKRLDNDTTTARYLAEIQERRSPSSASSATSSTVGTNSSLSDIAPSENRHFNGNENCYYHRLYCMLTAKYITFSSIKFRNTRLTDRGCIRSFRDSLDVKRISHPFSTAPKMKALVELELFNCDITLDWLNTILNELDNIAYLALKEVSFIDANLLVESKDLASRVLKVLKITGDRTCRINDSIFTYFLENFPAKTLDLTGTRIEYHKRIIQRFYPYGNALDLYSMSPTEFILTFPMILLYLKKYQSVVENFILDGTDITLIDLRRLLKDEDLKHLTISVRHCRMITRQERLQLSDLVEDSDVLRVVF